ncbi:esterase B1-like isoform X1 [Hermetia illucens]|uniref:esterase B1-like isoform X1 n=1 Tax=Hermetia illucens TaxID=343691 RepID=UPI0018CC20C9|nr:esterase B1-like isoform X1 [Hermetia illucens]
MFKIAFKYIGFRYRQHRRKTSEKLVVETVYGPVRGVKRISCWDDPYYSFERIPYAKPPVGELRFAEPQPPEPWKKIMNCTKEAEPPLQYDKIFNQLKGKEDCLYLNVYTTNAKPSTPKPVMIWIYGGGFELGGATKVIYSPDYFMRKDVVFVTFNYRVGALGFLSLKDPALKVPGNAGLKDQVMALKWVKNNIARFGGDPDNITVFGESAGGASTHYLMLTEQTRGLFHKAILMSGTVHMYWALTPDHDWAYRLAKKVGYTGVNDDAKVLEFLKKADGKAICRKGSNLLSAEEVKERLDICHGPRIEPYITDQCIIPKDPRLMARETWSNEIPLVLGGNSFEGLLLYPNVKRNMGILKELGDCAYLVPNDLNLDRNSEQCKEFGLRLKKEYFGDKEPTLFPYLNLLSYKVFWHGIHRTVLSRLKYASAPTYLYRFDFDSENFNHFRNLVCGKGVRGVCHADELTYMFNSMFGHHKDPGTKEYSTIQRMIGMWTQFAYNSDPNFAGIEPTMWRAVKKDNMPMKCMNISDEVTFIDLPEHESLKVWDSMYSEDKLI